MHDAVVEIEAGRAWWRVGLRELWSRRDLLALLLRKDLVAAHKQSILGPAWYVIQPLVTSLIFGLVFGRFARLSPQGVPPFLYYLAGFVIWNYFQASVNAVSASLTANSSILGKIYFPRLILPLVASGVSTVHFVLNYLVFLAVYAGFLVFGGWGGAFTPLRLLTLPLILLFVGVVGTGVGIWMAAWAVTYRDLRIGMPVILNLWMFATPVIWPMKMIPRELRWLFALNPMAPAVELHRAACLGTPVPDPRLLLIGAVAGLAAVLAGFVFFNRTQDTLVDRL